MSVERGYFPREKVDSLYPNALMIQPMGIWQIPLSKKHMTKEILAEKQGDYFAEIKKDGNWYAISTTEDAVYLFSRTISKKTGLLVEKSECVPHLVEAAKKLPPYTYIEGEIYYPHGNSDLVRTIMGCKGPKAIERQKEQGKIHFYIHNIVFYDNEDLTSKTNYERYDFLTKVYADHFADCEYVELAEIFTPEDYNFYNLAEEVINKGEEGLVLKRKDGKYLPDTKKAWETIKLKREDAIDAFVIGFEPPTMLYEGDNLETWGYWIRQEDEMRMQGCYHNEKGYLPVTKNYYYCWIGAIRIGVYDDDGNIVDLGTVSSGLTDEIKESIKNTPEDFLMKPALIECMEIYHGTSIRSPRLINFRDDINAKDCTLAKLK